MKKLIQLLSLSLFVMYGCSEEQELVKLDPKLSDGGRMYVYKMNGIGALTRVESVIMNGKNTSTKSQTLARSSGNSSANGHFSTFEGNAISFSTAENNGGNHGRMSISGNINLKGDVLCSVTDGNQVVIWVRTTHVGDLPDCGCDAYFAVGSTWLYLFEDNGEGASAPSDRYFRQVLTVGDENGPVLGLDPFCDEWGVTPSLFMEIFGDEWSVVAGKGDQIQVN
jgi:hypothetical protein